MRRATLDRAGAAAVLVVREPEIWFAAQTTVGHRDVGVERRTLPRATIDDDVLTGGRRAGSSVPVRPSDTGYEPNGVSQHPRA